MPLTCCGTAVSWADDALPPTTCARLAALFGLGTLPDTLREAAAAVETPDDGHSPLDAVSPETTGDHEVWVAGERAALPGFADALAVASVGDGPAAIHGTDPVSGVPVSLRLDDDPSAHCVDPPGSVVSFGVGPAVGPGGRPTREEVRRSLAPHVHLFTDRRTFRRFEGDSATPVVALRADEPRHARAVATLLRGLPRGGTADALPYGRADAVPASTALGSGGFDVASTAAPVPQRR
jgi:hypothetical protein